ncbi:DUF1857-domain-containing protein [Rhypophila decipiens]|uniref:DUF1857-domain-containing protein n=1 Tax=Rhypophila decipiens TaxID=261697 RepID=A0AAN6XWP4_9PEZI|nr:DUF1857-domain-containing protein [Rhypophila decipiens]
MTVINLGYTAQINREGQSVLTISQVWAGLERKVRHAEEFVPLISACEVLEEQIAKENGNDQQVEAITRNVTFRGNNGDPGRVVKEVCKLYPPCRVDFHQEDGSKIANYVTYGPSGEEQDLWMTYVFEWRHPDVQEGSDEAAALKVKHKTTAKMAVESSIETIRRLVAEGKL